MQNLRRSMEEASYNPTVVVVPVVLGYCYSNGYYFEPGRHGVAAYNDSQCYTVGDGDGGFFDLHPSLEPTATQLHFWKMMKLCGRMEVVWDAMGPRSMEKETVLGYSFRLHQYCLRNPTRFLESILVVVFENVLVVIHLSQCFDTAVPKEGFLV